MIDGKPGLIVSPKCKVFRKGMAGGYCYKRIQVRGDEKYHDKPNKNIYSHIVEAGEYLVLGAGEGKALVTKPKVKPKPPPRNYRKSPQGWMGN